MQSASHLLVYLSRIMYGRLLIICRTSSWGQFLVRFLNRRNFRKRLGNLTLGRGTPLRCQESWKLSWQIIECRCTVQPSMSNSWALAIVAQIGHGNWQYIAYLGCLSLPPIRFHPLNRRVGINIVFCHNNCHLMKVIRNKRQSHLVEGSEQEV